MAINRLTGSPTVAVTTRCAINVAECIPLCSTGVGSANINKKYIKKKTHPMRYNLSSTDLREKKKKNYYNIISWQFSRRFAGSLALFNPRFAAHCLSYRIPNSVSGNPHVGVGNHCVCTRGRRSISLLFSGYARAVTSPTSDSCEKITYDENKKKNILKNVSAKKFKNEFTRAVTRCSLWPTRCIGHPQQLNFFWKNEFENTFENAKR